MTIPVLYEDNHLLVLNKPAGMLSQGDVTGDESVVDWAKSYIKAKYSKTGRVFIGLPHRLDRPVSGVIILARTSKALVRLNHAFKVQMVRKFYLAVTAKAPPGISGELVHFIRKDIRRNKSVIDSSGKRSELHYQLISQAGTGFLLEVQPATGRPHQIRLQLAEVGCPIWGDRKYGFSGLSHQRQIALHCRRIVWLHPVKKKEMVAVAPMPEHGVWTDFTHHDR